MKRLDEKFEKLHFSKNRQTSNQNSQIIMKSTDLRSL